jgi:catechol 2,3-dioxygenase-like lactoylglutathione lyase family enzyme
MGGELYDMGRGRLTRLRRSTVPVPDLDEAIGYYRDVLGLETIAEHKDHNWAEVGWHEGGSIMLYVPSKEEKRQPGGDTGIIFGTDSLFELHRRLVDEGVEFVLKPERRPWGLMAIFMDLYGNRFTVMDDDKA